MTRAFVAAESRTPTDIIRPASGFAPISVAELWRYRDLLAFLLLRDIRVAVSGTRLGMLWLILPPLAMTAVLATVLGFFLRVPSALMPYPVLVISGLALWIYFSGVVNRASSSMLASAGLITKVYFPRILIPGIPVLAGTVELGVLALCVVGAAAAFGIHPRWQWLLLPLPLVLLVLMSLGAGIWASALAVRYRDFANALPVLLQIGLYSSPILYPIALVPASWRMFYALNPMVGIIESLRWMLAPGAAFPQFGVLVSIAFAAVLFVSGLFYFRRVEDSISDLV